MVSDELIANSRRQLLDTLRYLSCRDRQREYRDAVPYVHVPVELACQWEQHSSLMHGQQWFRDSLTPAELSAARDFDATFYTLYDEYDRDLPDFDVLWHDQRWADVGLAAAKALEAFA
jgi:hypothetical protein